MTTTIDDDVNQVNYQYKLNHSLDCSVHLKDTTSCATGLSLANGMTFYYPVYIDKFDGWRDTAGTLSGTTEVTLANKTGSVISTLSFAQADGDNLHAVGSIDTTYNLIQPHDYLVLSVTGEETGNGSGLHLNISARKA